MYRRARKATLERWFYREAPAPVRILLAGSGTSRHAAEIAAHWYRRWGLEAEAHPATELAERMDVLSAPRGAETPGSGVALVAVTQSGSTGSIRRLLDEAATNGVRQIVVTNEPESDAARRADLALVTLAGPERAIPATKSFTTALAALRTLGLDWADAAGTLSPSRFRTGLSDTGLIPKLVQASSGWDAAISDFAGRWATGPWFFLGDGSLLPLASEGALKMLETAAVPAMALPIGELAHGPAALLGPRTPVVVLSEAEAPTPGEVRSLAAAHRAGAPVLRFSERGARTEPSAEPFPIALPLGHAVGVELAPFVAAPALQSLALYAGVRCGRKVDAPTGLRKAVTDD